MNNPKHAYNFKNVDLEELKNNGGDYLPFDISNSILKYFPNQITYDKSMTYIFYPSYAKGTIGLVYCFTENSDKYNDPTHYFGWGTIFEEDLEDGFSRSISGLYLFAEDEHTTDYGKAEETMFKYVLLRKYE